MRYGIHILPEKLTLFRWFADLSNSSGNKTAFHACSAVTYFNIVKEYKKIPSFDELCAIFPEAREFDRGKKNTSVAFALAMVVLRLALHHPVALFALDILYELLEAPEARAHLLEECDFDRNTYAALISQTDPLAVAERLAAVKEQEEAVERIKTRVRTMPLYKIIYRRLQGRNLTD
jgi:hypothetical protein